MLPPAKAAERDPQTSPPHLAPVQEKEIAGRIEELENRDPRCLDEEVIKLDRWLDGIEEGLEREIKDLNEEIRQAQRVAVLAATLKETLAAQKELKTLDTTRNKKRRELFDAQDVIDEQRADLICKIENQLKQRQSVKPRLLVRWTVVYWAGEPRCVSWDPRKSCASLRRNPGVYRSCR